MKKTALLLLAVLTMVACKNDDTDFSAYTNPSGGTEESVVNTIYIAYNGNSVTVTGDDNGYVTTNGADVIVNTGTSADSLLLVLSGSTTDGSLLVNRSAKYGMRLNGVSIHNDNGPAINNQCGKALYLEVADSTSNVLTDGTEYTAQSYDQKGAFFSEGQILFSGKGSLSVTGSCKNAIACDDYIVFDKSTVTASSSVGSGIKVNDGLWVNGGVLNISVTGDGGRGIKCDSVVVVSGGSTTITTSGDCKIETTDGVRDTTSAACIKCDYRFAMTGGTLTMTSSGDGGKGINTDADVVFSGGTLSAVTTGDNEVGKPKAVKATTGITVSGGSFTAKVSKSWACDNGTDSEIPSERVTVVGTPQSASFTKKSVVIQF
jgi:hypothetical protein